MNVADDVEGTCFGALVRPHGLADEGGRIRLLGRLQHMHLAESLASQRAQGPAQLTHLVADDVRPEVAIAPVGVSVAAEALREVEHHRHWNHVILAGEAQQAPPGVPLNIGGVHDNQLAKRQALAGDEVEDFKRSGRDRLVVLVVGDKRAARIRRQDFGRLEVFSRKRRFAASGGPDEHDKRKFRKRYLHVFSIHKKRGGPIGQPGYSRSTPCHWPRWMNRLHERRRSGSRECPARRSCNNHPRSLALREGLVP